MIRRLARFFFAAIIVAGCGQSDGALLTDAPSHGEYDLIVEMAADEDYDTLAAVCPLRDMVGFKGGFMEGLESEGVYGADAEGMWSAFRRWCAAEGL